MQKLMGAATEFSVELPTITAALSPQEMVARQRRELLARTLSRQPIGRLGLDSESILDELHGAFLAAMIITYAEGLSLLATVAASSGTPFDVVESVRLWKEGNPARSPLLEEIASVLEMTPDLPNLLRDDAIAEELMEHQESLRRAVWRAHHLDLLTPAMLAALDYMDLRRDAWWPINLIQMSVRPNARRR
jgi:6-phosphogluconate dehydrogenase